MMRPLLIAALALFAAPAYAAFDCGRLQNINQDNMLKVNPRHVEECINRGFDLSPQLRPGGGRGGRANVGGGGGFSTLNLQAPNQPPAVRGYGSSVSENKMRFSLSFPPWAGFPCQLPGGHNICGSGNGSGTGGTSGGDTSSGDSACPVANDSSGTFGLKLSVGDASSYSLTCGGAIPLTTYQMTLAKNPAFLVATEHNSPYIWVYRRSGSGYSGASQPVALPTYLCKPTGKNGKMEQSITLTAPRAQFIAYDANARYIALRLVTNPDGDVLDDVSPLSPLANQEKYLRIPLQGGIPKVPENCADETQFYVPAAGLGGDITIETALESGCEATAAQCASAGISTTPSATASCDTVTVYLSGGTTTSPGAETCADMTQMMVVDRPNLLHLPGQSAKFATITGRTARMASTNEGSVAYLPSDNIIRLNQSSNNFVLPEGGTLGLINGKLIMYGPATLSPGSGQVVLTEGGEFRDNAGNTVTTYAGGSAMRPADGFPWLVQTSRSIVLPSGYELPTQPNPYIRAPIPVP